MKRYAAILLGMWLPLFAHAMTVEVHGNAAYASGPVVNDDLVRFQAALAQPGVDTVVFVNSPGGDLRNGMRVARLILTKGLDTVVAGHCVSACAIMFLGGKKRSFSDAFRPALTYVGIHGAHFRVSKIIDPRVQPQIFSYLKQRMGERFNADLINKALYEMDDPGALLRVFDVGRSPTRLTYHCKSSQTPRRECSIFAGANAFNMGIVTTPELTSLVLPKGFEILPKLFAQELVQSLLAPETYYEDLAVKHCSTISCRKLIQAFSTRKEHRALAIPVAGPGLAVVSDRDSINQAVSMAIHLCNHIKGRPVRLCEARAIDNFDVNEIYPAAMLSHEDALLRLFVPIGPYYADEQLGNVALRMNGLRTRTLRDATPLDLDGIKRVGTQELAELIKGPQAPVVVDVSTANEVIPGSLRLHQGGLAFESPSDDAVYEGRFGALLEVLGVDRNRPVIFYGLGRGYWHAANAAWRAKKLGYTDVAWYRGGLESWTEAKLPVAAAIVRAAVN